MKQIITSLDLGSNSIKLVVGEIFGNRLFVLCGVVVKSQGIKNGIITNPDKAGVAIKSAIKKLESLIGIKVDKVVVSVPSFDAKFIKGEGSLTFEEEKEIVGTDITELLSKSVYKKVSSKEELVSVYPIDFIINGEKIVKDPKGKETKEIAVNSIITTIPKQNADVLYDVLQKLDIKVADLSFGGMADYYEFREKEMINKSVAVINIGEDKTEVSIIEKDSLVGCETLEMGGRNIDRDISYIYDITLENARKLKEEFALCYKSKASTSEIVEVTTKSDETIKINQYEISEVVYSRVREILEAAKKSINLLTKHEISYIIITGGSTNIDGFKNVYSLVFGSTKVYSTVEDMGARNNKFSTSLGLIKLYADKLGFRGKTASTVNSENQKLLFNNKKKNDNTFFGKIYNYFFDN